MASKSLIFVTLALCSVFGSTIAAEADWEILNFAISNPGTSNPDVLKNSILNILASFVPPIPSITFADPATTAAPTTARPVPTAAPVTLAPITAAPVPVTTAAPVQPKPMPMPSPYPQIQLILPNGQPIYLPYPLPKPAPVMPMPQPTAAPVTAPPPAPTAAPQPAPCPWNHPAPCSCQKKNLAEFVVDVPCPTTTPKPIRQIVVKVPCPTTTKKPCECQCCPCNPCKSSKKKTYKESSESDSIEETKTVYKSYDPIIKKRVDAKRNDVPKAYPFSYHGTGGYQRVNVQRDADEKLYQK